MNWIVKGSTESSSKEVTGSIMLTVRKSAERGVGAHGWLNSKHSFSFAKYYDPKHMGFRSLRVTNEDRIEGGTGFGAHPHNDMEIISYVVSGALEHSDSMGTKAVIRPGEVQRMSAAAGVVHSEYNKLPDEQAHFFQIWIQPNKIGGAPGYGQKSFEEALNRDKLVLVVSESGRDGSIDIKQDADIYVSRMSAGESLDFKLRPKRGAWVQVVKGSLSVNGTNLDIGDAVSVDEEALLTFKAFDQSEFILFDLA
jgi:redox-sensitive bicupin YhaK (pirin superfamily)